MNIEALKFTRSQRSGLFALMLIILTLQLAFYLLDFNSVEPFDEEKQKWLSVQSEIDSLKRTAQRKVPTNYPFNPNFITDFKGYKLGMSVSEIDRLLAFRKGNKYVNSAEEFQNVTKVSDSLLATMSPYFKFPQWVNDRKRLVHYAKRNYQKKALPIIDINTATHEDLKKVYGIGDGLSERIIKDRERLGGFVSMEQMNDVWGLSEEVIKNLNKSFKISILPTVKKIKINKASVKELMQFPYFKYQLAKSIVTYRSMNGQITKADDLINISGFPTEKINIIALYLEF